MTITVCPFFTNISNDFSSVLMSWKWSPVEGSSKINTVWLRFSPLMKYANFTRWFSPPERVEEDCPSLMQPNPTSCSGRSRFTIFFSLKVFSSAKKSMAWFTVISSTSAMVRPRQSTSKALCANRLPLHASHVSVISAMNCISIVMAPSPLHSSHRPPPELKEKYPALQPICLANCCWAKRARISSNAFRQVAGLLLEDLPIGFWSTISTPIVQFLKRAFVFLYFSMMPLELGSPKRWL